jgi:hypothetical protein
MSLTATTEITPRPERVVREFRLWVPEPVRHWPAWLRTTLFLLALTAVSVFIRTRYLNGQFWMDEGIAVGISGHPLTAIPGILRADGSPPLYYMLLHIWMSFLGDSEAWTHTFSLLAATLTIPISYWAGKDIFDKRTGMIAAVMFAFSAFLTQYSQETRMYSLMALFGLLATIGFLKGFVMRQRRWVILFAVSQALMLYTHAWGIFYGAGALIALIILYRTGDEVQRRDLIRDGVYAYVAAGVLFLPWLPTFFYQATHTAAPWDSSPGFGGPVQISRDVMGGDRVTAAVVIAAAIGLSDLVIKRNRRTPLARGMWVLIAIPTATLLLAWIASQITPAWVPRYFAPIVAPMLLLAALGMARAGVVGGVAVALSVLFLINPASFTPKYKSNVKDIGGELGPMLHRGDLVIVGQPEEVPLAYYYLPAGLRFSNTIGLVKDPSFMNWRNALQRYRDADPFKVLPPILNALKPGQQLLYIRPMTEGAQNWEAPWTILVRRRSAQWDAIIAADKQLVPEAWAPHNYRGACCVADSAVLYKKL